MEKSSGWTSEEQKLLELMYDRHGPQKLEELFKDLGYTRSADAIRRKAGRAGLKDSTEVQAETSIEQTWKEIEGEKIDWRSPKDAIARQILVMSCWHIPFHIRDLIELAVLENPQASILVLAGDLLDCFAISKWPKVHLSGVALKKEYEEALDILEWLAPKFEKIILLKGNHEDRWSSYIADRVHKEARFLVNTEVLQRLADGEVMDETGRVVDKVELPNVEYIDASGIDAWWVRLGDAIVCHSTKSSSVPGKGLATLIDDFTGYAVNFNVLVWSHSHMQATIPYRGKVGFETGCMCADMLYARDAKMKYNRPAHVGYTLLSQDKQGRTILQHSKNVLLHTYTRRPIDR